MSCFHEIIDWPNRLLQVNSRLFKPQIKDFDF